MGVHRGQRSRCWTLRIGVVMGPDAVSEQGELYLDGEFWHFRFRDVGEGSASLEDIPSSIQHLDRSPIWVGVATGPKRLTKKEAQGMVSAIVQSQLRRQSMLQRSYMTVAQFVEHIVIPEYVESKTLFGRIQYRSMLKYVVNPEDVDRIFQDYIVKRRTRLRPILDWPYLGHLPLREVRTETVQNLISFALKQGYSPQTAVHIRNVVSTIFDCAKEQSYFLGENPAKHVQLPKLTRKEPRRLTYPEIVRLVSHMGYPVREIALFAFYLGMTLGEICGLQWKRVNLAEKEISRSDGEVIPARSINVREEWVRSKFMVVPKERKLSRTIPMALLPILRELKCRDEFTGLDDFVLVSRRGSPINPSHALTAKLKSVGKEINIPSLSWRHLRRIRREFISEFGSRFQDQMERLVRAATSHDLEHPVEWPGLVETELPY